MMDEILDPRIDQALESLPLEALPAGFTARVLARIEPRRAPAKRPFSIKFLDLAIPAFFLLFTVVAAVTTVWGLKQIDPFLVRRLQLELSWQIQRITPAVIAAAALAAGLALAALTAGFFSLASLLNPRSV